ncbi:MAG: hypothetical protein HUJ52_03025, partial [Malacoplasma sp.]|nr:hypothetical protein [Malacoplasma sp.]
IEKNKFNESWEIVNKKITFDSSYRFKSAWWIMFWVFCGICALYLVFGVIVFVGCFQEWGGQTMKSLGLGCGFSLILVFALFWITNNFLNASITLKPEYPDQIKKTIKKQSIWMNVFRICTAALTLVCGLMYITSSFMWDSLDSVGANTIKVITGIAPLTFMVLAGVSVTGYYLVILLKQRILNDLVPKHTTVEEAKI